MFVGLRLWLTSVSSLAIYCFTSIHAVSSDPDLVLGLPRVGEAPVVLEDGQREEDPRCRGHIGELILEGSSMDLTVWVVAKEIQVIINTRVLH